MLGSTSTATGMASTLLPKALSALLPALLLTLITSLRLSATDTRDLRCSVEGLAASDHYPGQDVSAIGILHQHSAAQASYHLHF